MSSDEDQWNAPLASSAIVKAEDAVSSLNSFTTQAVKRFGCEIDLEVDRENDLLKQMVRKYKNPGCDVTRPLCVEFVGEAGVDAGGVTREFFSLVNGKVEKARGFDKFV